MGLDRMKGTILTLGGGGFSMSDDGVALLWRDGSLVEAVSERAGGQAFRVERTGDGVSETPLVVRYLG
jgi:dipeptidase E